MKQLFLLLGILVTLTYTINAPARQRQRALWCVAADDNDLASLLEREGFRLKRGSNVKQVLSRAPKGASVLLLADGQRQPRILTNQDISLIREKRLRVFADFTALSDTLPRLREATVERVVVKEPMGSLKPMDLLTVNRARFIEADTVRPLLVLARVVGFDDAVFGLTDTRVYSLVDHPVENIFVSTACLSDFSKLRLMPEDRWQTFWEAMLTQLTGHETVFHSWPSRVRPAYSKDEPLPDTARLHAVRKGIEWFYSGHFLVHPSWKAAYLDKYQSTEPPLGPAVPADAPVGDGSAGVLEGHGSAIDADGKQAYRYWLRTDVHGESAMAFALAAKLLGQKEYDRVASRLIDYALAQATAGPRSDTLSPSYGLISWGFPGFTKDVYYGDDNARFLLGALLAAHLMNEKRWNKKLRDAIDANFQTTSRDGFRGARLEERDIQKNGRSFYQERHLVNPHPHYESWMWAVYLWLYSQTGEEEFLTLSEKGIAQTMKAYPVGWRWTNGIQQERARMVLPLAWLYRVAPTAEHRGWLYRILADLKVNQVACGAIREELGDPSKGDFGGPKSNAQYGRGEAPLIFKNGDPVADMLYTSNFAIFGLNEAARATGDPDVIGMAENLANFLVRIQANSTDCRDVDGAWYRAFNYRDWNWWASNSDAGWGNLSTLTGWIQSWITGTLAMMQMNTSYWELTHNNKIKE